MFNLYQYEKLEQDESKRVNSTSNHPKKIAKYISKCSPSLIKNDYLIMCKTFN